MASALPSAADVLLGEENERVPLPMNSHVRPDSSITPILSVVMPVYNELATIEEILRRVHAVDIEKEVIVVDDFSTDGTRQFLQRLARETQNHRFKFLFQDRNYGKGAALRRGFAEACGHIVVIQDADLELNPQEYRILIEPIQSGRADVVYGSRFLGKAQRDVVAPHFWGNRFLTIASNFCTGLALTDVWTCYKTFRREVLYGMRLCEDRFAFEPEFTAKIAASGWRVAEVPISYVCRTAQEGKKISWRDGFRGLYSTIYYSLSARFGIAGDVTPAVIPERRVAVRH